MGTEWCQNVDSVGDSEVVAFVAEVSAVDVANKIER
jgi:hypothetical protein